MTAIGHASLHALYTGGVGWAVTWAECLDTYTGNELADP